MPRLRNKSLILRASVVTIRRSEENGIPVSREISHGTGRPAPVPVDGHVHLYTLERAAASFDSAATNFRRYGARAAGCLGILLLTQTSREHVFDALREQERCESWNIGPVAAEEQSLMVQREGCSLVLISGRQIRCEGGLEVAALGTTAQYPDGMVLEDTIERVKASGALAALPWGFGKWTGARGRTVREALRRHSPGSIAVGDNGGRLALLGRPSLIRMAHDAGYHVLSGSDPFPSGDDYRRVGSFGFFAEVDLETSAPWRSLTAWLTSEAGRTPAGYGHAIGPLRFLANQIGIRCYNAGLKRAVS